MKFGLTGDTHNNLKNIREICSIFNRYELDFVIHTGDITLSKSLELFKELKMPLKGVFGNNDQDEKQNLCKIIEIQYGAKVEESDIERLYFFSIKDL